MAGTVSSTSTRSRQRATVARTPWPRSSRCWRLSVSRVRTLARNSSGSTGPSRKSSAPASNAWRRSRASSKAVTTTTGTWVRSGWARKRRMKAAPSRTGILKSVMQRSGQLDAVQSSASTGSAKAWTMMSAASDPASFERIFKLMRRSSTTTTMGIGAQWARGDSWNWRATPQNRHCGIAQHAPYPIILDGKLPIRGHVMIMKRTYRRQVLSAARSSSRSRSLKRWILPVSVRGRAVMNSTARGYL